MFLGYYHPADNSRGYPPKFQALQKQCYVRYKSLRLQFFLSTLQSIKIKNLFFIACHVMLKYRVDKRMTCSFGRLILFEVFAILVCDAKCK